MKGNILITGTPGVGKSRLCTAITKNFPEYKWLNISKIAIENKLVLDDLDEDFNCPIIDEDKILEYLEPYIQEGGNIIEYHSCDFFPECYFDQVYVITCDNTILYDRLKLRGYTPEKIRSNVECEIFGMIVEEAREVYDPVILQILKGDKESDFEDNYKQIIEFLQTIEKQQELPAPQKKKLTAKKRKLSDTSAAATINDKRDSDKNEKDKDKKLDKAKTKDKDTDKPKRKEKIAKN